LNFIDVDSSKCTGCRLCQHVCALKKFNKINPNLAAIRVVSDDDKITDMPLLCKQCAQPLCVEACPSSSFKRNSNGAYEIDNTCIGCYQCVDACPFGAIFVHEEMKLPIKCDLCGGEPECVKHCPTGAISIVENVNMGTRKRDRRQVQ